MSKLERYMAKIYVSKVPIEHRVVNVWHICVHEVRLELVHLGRLLHLLLLQAVLLDLA